MTCDWRQTPVGCLCLSLRCLVHITVMSSPCDGRDGRATSTLNAPLAIAVTYCCRSLSGLFLHTHTHTHTQFTSTPPPPPHPVRRTSVGGRTWPPEILVMPGLHAHEARPGIKTGRITSRQSHQRPSPVCHTDQRDPPLCLTHTHTHAISLTYTHFLSVSHCVCVCV